MFGGLAFLVHGNMAVAASSERRAAAPRSRPSAPSELLAEPHTDEFVMRGASR